MWWADLRRAARPILASVLLAGLAGCTGFRPLYADPALTAGSTLAASRADIGRLLSEVDIEPQTSRVGVQLRNDLLFALRGRGDDPARSRFRLTMSLARSSSDLAPAAISGRSTSANLTLSVSYTLRRTDGAPEPIFNGRAIARASFDKGVQRFANIRAERDAEDRATRDVADQIRNGLAAYFARESN